MNKGVIYMSHWDKIYGINMYQLNKTHILTYIDTRCVIFLGNRQVENLMSAGYHVLFSGGTVSGHQFRSASAMDSWKAGKMMGKCGKIMF